MLESIIAAIFCIVFAVSFIFAVLFWRKWRSCGQELAKAITFTVISVIVAVCPCILSSIGYLDSVEHPETLTRNGYTYVRSEKPIQIIEYNGYEYYLVEK